jgi:mycothiol system anti-sigma-R factor
MSCGTPHDRDCAEVLENLFLFLDREMEEASCAEIQQHLDECAPCLAKYNLEQVVKALVARSCREPAPPTLRERVLFKIHSVQLEIRDPRADPGLGR